MKRCMQWFCGLFSSEELEREKRLRIEARQEIDHIRQEIDQIRQEIDRANLSVWLAFVTIAPVLITCSLELNGGDKSFEEFARAYAAQAIFDAFVVSDFPPLPHSSGAQPLVENIWGTEQSSQAAHIIPLARSCSSEWPWAVRGDSGSAL